MNRFGLTAVSIFVASALWMGGCATPDFYGFNDATDVVIMDGVMHPVKEGDTIQSIARAYEVSPQLLVRVNGVPADGDLRPGSRLFIPGAQDYKTVTPAHHAIASTDNTVAVENTSGGPDVIVLADPEPTPVPDEKDGLWHKVNKGETLTAIAAVYDKSPNDLQRVNNLPDASKLRAGQVLWIPGAKQVEDVEIIKRTVVTTEPVKELQNNPVVVQNVKPAPTPTPKPEEAAQPPQEEFPRKVSEFANMRFQWPIKENFRIVRPFSSSGAMNAGIDLGAPIGTDVCAAAKGKVQLVGGVADDVGGSFGNFIIIYHGKYKNDDVRTIYAHNSENLVQMGQIVERGQVIAKVGKSGTPPASEAGVLRFEIRQSTTALDPIKILPSLNE